MFILFFVNLWWSINATLPAPRARGLSAPNPKLITRL